MVEDNTNQRENILPSELWWSQMRSFSPWQLPAFPLYLVEQAVALRVGADVVHKSPGHVPNDAQDLPVIVRPLSPDDPVDVRIVQQDVLLGIDAGGHVIVQLDDALLQRVAYPKVRPAAPDQQIIQREATDVHRDDLIELRYPLVDGHGCRIRYPHLIGDALIGEPLDAPAPEIILELPVQCAVMLRGGAAPPAALPGGWCPAH